MYQDSHAKNLKFVLKINDDMEKVEGIIIKIGDVIEYKAYDEFMKWWNKEGMNWIYSKGIDLAQAMISYEIESLSSNINYNNISKLISDKSADLNLVLDEEASKNIKFGRFVKNYDTLFKGAKELTQVANYAMSISMDIGMLNEDMNASDRATSLTNITNNLFNIGKTLSGHIPGAIGELVEAEFKAGSKVFDMGSSIINSHISYLENLEKDIEKIINGESDDFDTSVLYDGHNRDKVNKQLSDLSDCREAYVYLNKFYGVILADCDNVNIQKSINAVNWEENKLISLEKLCDNVQEAAKKCRTDSGVDVDKLKAWYGEYTNRIKPLLHDEKRLANFSDVLSTVNHFNKSFETALNNINNNNNDENLSNSGEESYIKPGEDLSGGVESGNGDVQGAEHARPVTVDPLILDINGDGFNIETKKYGTHFDLDCNDFAEKINWTNKDAILAIDLNGNGKIDNGREVFGDYHLLENGNKAKNGFEALTQYDKNKDGVINKNDEVFDKLKLWVDADGNGNSDKDELKSLSDMQIKSINLNYKSVNKTIDSEALIGNAATFEYEDGKTGEIGEMWVSSDLYDTIEKTISGVTEATNGLPNVRSIGTLNSLHNAIEKDKTGKLKNLVESFVNETDNNNKRINYTKQILNFMCHTENIAANSRGNFINAKDLAVIETFMGKSFMGVNGKNPNAQAAPILNKVYNNLVEMYCFAMIGSQVTEHLNYITAHVEEDGSITPNMTFFNKHIYYQLQLGNMSEKTLSDICAYLGYYGTNIKNDYTIFGEFRRYMEKTAPQYVDIIDNSVYGAIRGSNNNDSLYGTNISDVIYGNDGNDVIIAGSGNDYLFGGKGNDKLVGDSGDDYLNGGQGDDTLLGGQGDDTYSFGKNHGNDIVTDGIGNNKLEFTDKLSFGEYQTSLNADLGLVLTNKETGETITVTDFLKNPLAYNFEFNDKIENDVVNGSDKDDVLNAGNGINAIYGNDGNDKIYGGSDINIMYGGNGDDSIYSGIGTSVMDGENGEDTYYISANHGNNYIFDKSGKSKLIFDDSLSADDYETSVSVNLGLILKNKNSGAVICISDFINNPTNFEFEFADKTKAIGGGQKHDPVIGTDQNDCIEISDDGFNTIYGNDGDDFIAGGKDMDIIMGGNGNDQLHGRNGTNFIYGEDGNDTIYDGDDSSYLNGGSGDDKIYGGGDNDILDGGIGNDYLQGDHGDDTYIFRKGYGTDTINASSGNNTVLIYDLTAAQMVNTRNAQNDLIIKFKGTDDSLIIQRFFDYNNNRDLNFVFDNGEKLGQYDVKATYEPIYGTDADEWLAIQNGDTGIIYGGKGNDGLSGGSGNDTLYGEDGDDQLYGNDGNDILDGGKGNDTLNGGNGTDTYVFGKGYGNDTVNEWGSDYSVIKLADINYNEVTVSNQNDSNLVISINGTDDTLIINNFKWGQATYTIKFADGAEATVNKDTWELTFDKLPDISEKDIIQNNADVLSDIYSDDSLTTDILDGYADTVIPEMADTSVIGEKDDNLSAQTDIQVMILAENMAGFADENKVSEGVNFSDTNENTMSQLLVNSQAQ